MIISREKDKEWDSLSIETYSDEIICLTNSEGKRIFEDSDSDNLAPFGAYTKDTPKRSYQNLWNYIMSKIK